LKLHIVVINVNGRSNCPSRGQSTIFRTGTSPLNNDISP